MNNENNNFNMGVQPETTPTQPIQPTSAATTQSTEQTIQPTPAVPTQSIVEETKIEEPIVTSEDISDVANTTFDYNAIYGNSSDIQSDVVDKNNINEDTNKTVFKTQELNIEARSLNNRTSADITPDFNINSLDKNTNEDDSRKSDNVLSDKQKDKADTRRKIIFIAIIVIILIVFVEFIFPLINGYKF